MEKAPKYRIYSDESGWNLDSSDKKKLSVNQDSFGSLAGITIDLDKIPSEKIEDVEAKWKNTIKRICEKHEKPIWNELKFENVGSFYKIEIVMAILNDINTEGSGGLRIYVLTWSKEEGEKEYEQYRQYGTATSFSIMYYYLLCDIINTSQEGKVDHALHADKATQLKKDWLKTQQFLASRLKKLLGNIKENFPLPEKSSQDNIFIQLADILAGFVRHTFVNGKSYTSYKAKEEYKKKCSGDLEHQHRLCYKIEEWLKKRKIEYFSLRGKDNGGIRTVPPSTKSKEQAVNLWRFQVKKQKDEESKSEEKPQDNQISFADKAPPSADFSLP